MKVTRHNGRSGKHGVYNPKHNDRQFDVAKSDHIDAVRALGNVNWDYLREYRFPDTDKPDGMSFEDVELHYYETHYGDYIRNQNARNEMNRHPERNRSVKDLYRNKMTCPEETIYQIGNIDGTVMACTLCEVVEEFFAEYQKRFGSHVKMLDWSLHVDEATPHIYERHVFECKNQYGELCPQQEKALEELAIPLPDPKKPKGRNNNRKQTFDAICREMLLDICKRHVRFEEIDEVPVYGGKKYLEKNDYIIKKQKETMDEQKSEIVDNCIKLGRQKKELSAVQSATTEFSAELSEAKKSLTRTRKLLSGTQEELEESEKKLEDVHEEIRGADEVLATKHRSIMVSEQKLKVIERKTGEADEMVDDICKIVYEVVFDDIVEEAAKQTQAARYSAVMDYTLDMHKESLSDATRNRVSKALHFVLDLLEQPVKNLVCDIKYRLQSSYHTINHKDDIRDKVWDYIENKAEREQEESLANQLVRRRGGRHR